MDVRLRTDDVPAHARREYWQHVFQTVTVPYRLRDTGNDFHASMDVSEFGPIRLLRVDAPPGEAVRTQRQIRMASPDVRMVVVQTRGSTVWQQDDRECVLAPGDLTFINLTRPVRCRMAGASFASLRFSPAMLPIGNDDTDTMRGLRLPGTDESAALVSTLVRQVARDIDAHGVAVRSRIGSAFLDLVTAALTARLNTRGSQIADAGQRALVLRIQAFIHHHLPDPDLSPSTIAAAHHISVRYLHKLFETQEATVGEWIRKRRIERCKADLLTDSFRDRPVASIGARWGFVDARSFSRVFRSYTGMPPTEFRLRHSATGPESVA